MHRTFIAAAAAAMASLALLPGSASALTVISGKSFSAVEGTLVKGQGIVSFDDTGACHAADYTVEVNWGDGTVSPIAIPKAVGLVPGTCSYDARGDHAYTRAGTYSVSAHVCLGATCADTQVSGLATISEAALKGEAAGQTATAGRAFSGQIAELKDDNQLSHATDFAATVDWGDGSVPGAGTITGDAGNYTIDGSHTYAAAGGYRLTVTVQHNGRSFVLDPATVTVNPGAVNPTTNPTTAPTATVRIIGGRVTVAGLRRNGLRLRIGVSNANARRLLVRLRDARTGRSLWSRRITLSSSQVRNGQRTADVRVRIPRSILNRLRRGRSYGISFPRQGGLPSFGTAFVLR